MTSNVEDAGATAGFGPTEIELSGSIVVSLPTLGTTTVSEVATIAAVCGGDSVCQGDVGPNPTVIGDLPLGVFNLLLTATTLATPVDVADGQSVSVTVTLSFN